MQDILIKSGRERLSFRFLKWDSGFFGLPSFLLDVQATRVTKGGKGFREKALEAMPRRSFITAKVPLCSSRKLIDFLGDIGFRYIGTEMVLEYAGKSGLPSQSVPGRGSRFDGMCFFKARSMPQDAFLLGNAFTMSRFHSDRKISRKKADLLWRHYIRNAALSRGTHLFCAQMKRRTVGIIFVKLSQAGTQRSASLALVAVKEGYRGRHIGSRLMQSALEWCKERSRTITVETQAENLAALNFYIKNGFFRIKETRLVLHRWSP